LTEFTSPYGLNAQQGWHTSESHITLPDGGDHTETCWS